MHLPAVMAPPTEQSEKLPVFKKLPLNERILSSMTRKNVAAHPWHDLEIGMCDYLDPIQIISNDKKSM